MIFILGFRLPATASAMRARRVGRVASRSGEAGGFGWRAGLSESNGGQVCGEYKSSPAVAA